MKKIVTAATSVTVVLFAGTAVAQEEQEAPELSFTPIETYICNFNEGKGPADLSEVIKEWNEWMDAEGQTDYFAVTLWPSFYGERLFDVGWLGVWPDGNVMGAGTDHWLTSGQEIGAGFYEVLDCTSHTQFASTQVKEPPESDMEAGDMFVLAFSNCSMEEEKTFADYLAAQEEWNAYADQNGFAGGSWALFPVWGENVDADYDFKAVSSSPNYTTLGADWQRYAEGAYETSNDIFEGLLDCDSTRIYTTRVERLMADDD